ncbi:MAG: CHAD domain-containing protein [Thiohalocapsa sp.]
MKLAARPRDLPALTRALQAKAGGGDVAPERLVSTYYDTAERDLQRQGLVLRVRQRNGHFIQTVKGGPEDSGNGLARGEWEDEIGGARPDPAAPQSGRFLDPQLSGKLQPLFRTEVGRATIALAIAPNAQIEAAVDRGRVCLPAGTSSEPISEVELELKSGSPTALYDVALDLLAVAPVRLERRSKAERGHRLTGIEEAPPVAAVHAEAVDLDRRLSGDEALRRIGLSCLNQIMRNEAAVEAALPDGIHQMRVAVRRLRAVLSTFARKLPADQRRALSQELRWLATALGAARNLDVFEKSLAPAAAAASGDGDLDALVEATAARRRSAYAQAIRAVRSRRYTALLLRLLRWFEGRLWRYSTTAEQLRRPIAELATSLLDRRLRAVRRRSKGFAAQSPPQRHQLRIALKKLRYAAEALAGLYRRRAVERFLKRVKRLQDDLGDANDVRVGHDIVVDLAKNTAGNTPGNAPGNAICDTAIAAAGEAVLHWHERRLAQRGRQLRKHLDRLLAAEPFWQLR